MLAEYGGVEDPVVLAAALLHDTVEDTETSLEEMEAKLGPEGRRVVAEVSDDKSLPAAERKRLQVLHTAEASDRAKLIKMADKICNAVDLVHSPPVGWTLRRQADYLDWTARVVACCRGLNEGIERLYDEVLAQATAAVKEREKSVSS